VGGGGNLACNMFRGVLNLMDLMNGVSLQFNSETHMLYTSTSLNNIKVSNLIKDKNLELLSNLVF